MVMILRMGTGDRICGWCEKVADVKVVRAKWHGVIADEYGQSGKTYLACSVPCWNSLADATPELKDAPRALHS